jgi:hypothetical protein
LVVAGLLGAEKLPLWRRARQKSFEGHGCRPKAVCSVPFRAIALGALLLV